MHTIKFALAISLAALAFSTSLAGAVSTLPPGPVTTPDTPIINDHGNDIGRPLDPSAYFTQDFIDRQPLHVKAPISCSTHWWFFPDTDTIWFTNDSGKYIPAGTTFTWTVMPSGATATYTLETGLAPGEDFEIHNILDGNPKTNQDCDIIMA